MKNIEAIENLKLMQAQIEWDYPMDYAAAIDLAIAALEKQIPMKHDTPEFDIEGYLVYPCGGCGSDVANSYYCPWCGQKMEVRDADSN